MYADLAAEASAECEAESLRALTLRSEAEPEPEAAASPRKHPEPVCCPMLLLLLLACVDCRQTRRPRSDFCYRVRTCVQSLSRNRAHAGSRNAVQFDFGLNLPAEAPEALSGGGLCVSPLAVPLTASDPFSNLAYTDFDGYVWSEEDMDFLGESALFRLPAHGEEAAASAHEGVCEEDECEPPYMRWRQGEAQAGTGKGEGAVLGLSV